MYFYNGGGVGTGDINSDGLSDIFLSGNMVSSRLYLNKGNFEFEDITEKAGITTEGWCTGIAMVDINHDGFLDIYVSKAGSKKPADRANLLFINNQDNTFTESALQYGIADTGYTTQAAFFDYDNDKDLDLYLLTHDHAPKALNTPYPKKVKGEGLSTDKLYRNNGNGTFTDVSAEAGILIEGYGLGVVISDLNNDGWPDIYVSNDFLSNDLLYINNKNGTFSNKVSDYLKHQTYNSMGADIADYNNDGLSDIIVVDMLPEDNYRQKMMGGGLTNDKFNYILHNGYEPQYIRNTLQLNNVNTKFNEIGRLAGIDKTDWSWAPLFADFDNDGHKDLFITNGYLKDITDKDFISYSKNMAMFKDEKESNKTLLSLIDKQKGVKIPNYAFKNNQDLTFSNVTDHWGFDQPSFSNGAAYADLDHDGDLDLVINNINDEAFIYRNGAEKLNNNHYLNINLQGDSLNPMALDAKVILHHGGKVQFHEHTLYRGYQSSVGNTVHFGLGKEARVDTVEILWPDGKQQHLLNVAASQNITVNYQEAEYPDEQEEVKGETIFAKVSDGHGIDFVHKENNYSDFNANALLPQTYSANGPSLAAGDVNGDGLEDFYVGGAADYPGTIFFQKRSGQFSGKEFPMDARYEDLGALLFDSDNDGDLDLYVVSGGSEFEAGTSAYQDRLYINDGKGNFQKDSLALPEITSSGASVSTADFDRDGDLDIFIGGRINPGKYPLAPESYILQNNGGKFTDVTRIVCPELKNMGMVTSSLWTDFDNDGQVDLIVVGEWMPITFLKNTDGVLTDITASTGLGETSGWWNSVAGGDMDNDGDIDYIMGNLGLNTPFKASEEEPLSVVYGDFDNSGVHHAVVSWYIQGENYPLPARDLLFTKMPGLKKRFQNYHDYAKAKVENIISTEALEKAFVLKSSYFSSAYLENNGDGNFTLHPLPIQAQFAPVNGILIKDIDYDGNQDVLLTGNSYAPDVSIGRYNAFSGVCLKGNGKGEFTDIKFSKSGFFVDSDAKSLIQLYTASDDALIVSASNGDSLALFSHAVPIKTKYLKLKPLDAFATLHYSEVKTTRVELYYHSGYLSQSSRILEIPEEVEFVTVTDFSGRELTYNKAYAFTKHQ